jgi:glutamate dehydrogenase
VLADLARSVLVTADGSIEHWAELNERGMTRALEMHTEIRRVETFDITTLSVALRQLRNLSLTAASR